MLLEQLRFSKLTVIMGASIAVVIMLTPCSQSTATEVDDEKAWQVLTDEAFELYRQGLYGEGARAAEKALSFAEGAFGQRHPNVATSLNNLALLYKMQNQYADVTERMYKRAIGIWRKALGSEHPRVAMSMSNLGEFYRVQGRYLDAEPWHKRALTIREQSLGENHPVIAQSLNNLGELYRAQGYYERAEPFYRRALDIYEHTQQPNLRELAIVLENYSALRIPHTLLT